MKKLTFAVLFFYALLPGLALAAGQTSRVSVDSDGTQGNFDSANAALSADGRFVAFESKASNLVDGDSNGRVDIFVRDRQRATTTRVSVNSDGIQTTLDNVNPALSADGRYVAFESRASNLVTGDSNGRVDIFVHDRQSGETSRVSVDSLGGQGNFDSANAALSADGRFVAFESKASNLVTGDSNFQPDIFVHDRQSGETSRVSVDSLGGQGNFDSANPALSADGRYVAFESKASNLVTGDSNFQPDIFVHDRQSSETSRVSISSTGTQGNFDSLKPALSANGRYVAFESRASNLVDGDSNFQADIFVHDRQAAKTTRVSVDSLGTQGNFDSANSALSADGRFVAFESKANNLVTGDSNFQPDIFVRDRQAAKTSRVSVNNAHIQGNLDSLKPALNADGRFVAFESQASNLVVGDSNVQPDIFIRDRLKQRHQQADVSLALSGPTGAADGSTASYTFKVTNHGSVNAGKSTLIGIVSNHGQLKSLSASQGACRRAAVSVCRLGVLTPGQLVTITAKVTINGDTTISATAQAAPKDGKPGNNAKSLTTLLQ